MISFERTRNLWLINTITSENSKYLLGTHDFKDEIGLDDWWFILLKINNVTKGYYLVIDRGDKIFDCHLCIRKVSPDLNIKAANMILSWFREYKGAKRFVTYTTPENKKAKAFAKKLGFESVDDNTFELRIKNGKETS